MKQVLNGSEIVLECLKEQGVDTVFGYPGGAILNIYDELYKQSDKIHHVLTSHEQGASHAADGYARATGKVGVCMATSGPGATNLVTGLATAYMDSIPVVAITANVGVSLLGKDSFQEIDIKGVTMPVTKHNYIVKDVEKLADTIREAFQIAQSGRKGPVLVDITKDVTAAKTYFESMTPPVIHPVCETIKEKSVKEAIEMMDVFYPMPASRFGSLSERLMHRFVIRLWERVLFREKIQRIQECLVCMEQRHQILEYQKQTY